MMAGEKKTEKSNPMASGNSDSSTKFSEKDMVDGTPSNSLAQGSGASGIEGYSTSVNYSDSHSYLNSAGGSYAGFQSDNGSLLYYLPGYDPYASGYMGVEGKQSYVSPGYLQQPVSYGSDAFPCYTWDPTYSGDARNGIGAKPSNPKSSLGLNGSAKSFSLGSSKANSNFTSKTTSALHSEVRHSAMSSNFSKSFTQINPLKPINKFGSSFQSPGLVKGFQPAGKFSSFSDRQQGGLFMNYGPTSYQSAWNGDYKYKSRGNYSRSGFEASNELARGPRASLGSNPTKLSPEDEQPTIQRDKYNLQDFETEYDLAKFFVIKSYSEDDVHKSIKYNVWSSTSNGNKKLDAAFREAEAQTNGTAKRCPMFLFFSVNASGQFLGVAEMIGMVDFNKNMNFWQLDKWNGFFPVKWHIVKDVPNSQLRHIILENSDNRAVTYTRDTQEIGLKQGLEMLSIFKNFAEKSSILDDFNFYEDREKSLKAKRSPAPEVDVMKGAGFLHLKAGEKMMEEEPVKSSTADFASSLIGRTKNLSLKSHPLKNSA